MKLEVGYNTTFEIRNEYYRFDGKESFTVLFLSDFHFNGYCKKISEIIAEKLNSLNPDIILLGGDYVDTKEGLLYFDEFMRSISQRKNVFAIAGNHDYFFGIDKIIEVIEKNNAIWIEKSSCVIELNKRSIRIDGTNSQNNNDTEFSILCLHKPIDFKKYCNDYNLVFAGHLHGGQFVVWESYKGLYPGRLFYKWNILKAEYNTCLYLISKGLGDTLPVRYNCKKDIICVHVT